MLFCLPEDVIINNILSHLYPSDLLICKKVNTGLKNIIEENEDYIDTICQHIQPHGKIESVYYDDFDCPCCVQYYPDYTYYKEGQKHGEYKRWSDEAELLVHCFYKDGEKHGEYKEWYEESVFTVTKHQLQIHGFYKNGKVHGECKIWHEDGQLKRKMFYIDGESY